MFKNNSIFKKITRSNIIFSLIIFCIILVLSCFLICSNYNNEKKMIAQNCADAYAHEIKTQISAAVQQSNMVLRYNYLIENLNREFTKNSDILEFLNATASYFDTIFSGESTENIVIYHSNSTIYENRYFLKITRLENSNKILKYFEENNSSIYREKELFTDEQGNKYLVFYRKMPFNPGSLLAYRCYLPKNSNFIADVNITYADEKLPRGYVSSAIDSLYIAYAPVESSIAMNVLFIVIFIVLGVIFMAITTFLAYRTTAKTTSEIESFINSLASDDLMSLDISLNSVDPIELSIIKNAIHTLVSKIKETTEANYKFKYELQDLKFQLLQNKFNPHLLYNSLSVIKLKAFRYKDKEITTIINDLVAYYRAVLNKDKKNITIADEIILLKKFVSVNEISHEKKYDIEFDIPDDLMTMEIPHLLLQPFIENSISHGLSTISKDCKIKVSCCRENGFIKFTIYDNGTGIDEETLKKLNNLESYNESYGIKNAYLRIQLMYGKDCDISFESEINKYTKVVIKIGYKPVTSI